MGGGLELVDLPTVSWVLESYKFGCGNVVVLIKIGVFIYWMLILCRWLLSTLGIWGLIGAPHCLVCCYSALVVLQHPVERTQIPSFVLCRQKCVGIKLELELATGIKSPFWEPIKGSTSLVPGYQARDQPITLKRCTLYIADRKTVKYGAVSCACFGWEYAVCKYTTHLSSLYWCRNGWLWLR